MKSWPAPFVPAVPGHGDPLSLFDTRTRSVRPVDAGPVARLYVCGITPYDATHLGHAATYVTFDLVGRALRDAGHRVEYVQNVTDVDDPLLERAARDGRDWRELATAETDLFREDMTALAVIPPDALVGVVESMPEITREVRALLDGGTAYRLPVPAGEGSGTDIYLDLGQVPSFGSVSGWSREQMAAVFADRGGIRTGPASATPSTPCSGAGDATANRAGTTRCSARAAPGGTSSAPPSPSTGSATRSTSRVAAPTSSSPTTR